MTPWARTRINRPFRIQIALGVLMALSACAHPQPNAPESSQSSLLNGAVIDGGGNPNDDMLAPDNRGDVLILSDYTDFTKLGTDRIKNIETLSMLNSDGAKTNGAKHQGMIIIDVAHVLAMAGTGYAAPTDPGYDRHPALKSTAIPMIDCFCSAAMTAPCQRQAAGAGSTAPGMEPTAFPRATIFTSM